MSIFKTNKFFRVIKHFILCLPLMFVLGTSLYTIVNPNSKDSYSEYKTTKSFKLDDGESTIVGQTYKVVYTGGTFVGSQEYLILNNQTNIVELLNNGETWLPTKFLTYFEGGRTRLVVYDTNNVQHNIWNWQNTINGFYFVSANAVTLPSTTKYYNLIYTTYTQGTLDNAFEFGLQKFNDIGFGKVDFLTLFNNIFTTSVDNVYLHFINDYLNYYLMVECIYFVPWVLHTFIHFAYDLGEYFTDSFKRKKGEDD